MKEGEMRRRRRMRTRRQRRRRRRDERRQAGQRVRRVLKMPRRRQEGSVWEVVGRGAADKTGEDEQLQREEGG